MWTPIVVIVALIWLAPFVRRWLRSRRPAGAAAATPPPASGEAGPAIPFSGRHDVATLRAGLLATYPWLRFGSFVALALGLLLSVASVPDAVRAHAPGRAFAGLFPLLLGALGAYMYFLSPGRLLRTSRVHGLPFHGHLDADGLLVESEVSKTDLKWDRLHSAVLSRDALFLYLVPPAGIQLHRSFFAGEEDWRSATELIRSRLTVREPARRMPVIRVAMLLIFVCVLVSVLAGPSAKP